MANRRLDELTAVDTLLPTDLLYLERDPDGTQVPRAIAASDLAAWFLPWADVVEMFGADPTGTLDSTAEIEAAMAWLEAQGGGVCFLRPGLYKVSQFENPDHAGVWSAIQIRNKVKLLGSGEGCTTILLAAAQGDHAASHIISNRDQAGDNQTLVYEAFTLDGNAANQTELFMGILTTRTRGVTYRDVTVKNVRGDDNAPPGETFHIENSFCTDVRHIGCTVTSDDGGDTATGFSCDVSTNISYVGCVAYGMEHGHGFTHWHCSNVRYTACDAQLNGDLGFNSEFSRDVTYVGCDGGGISNDEADSYPYTESTSLGNGGSGFVCNASTRYRHIGCSAVGNGDNGFSAVNSGTDYGSGEIIGGDYTGNTNHGLFFGPSNSVAPNWSVSPETQYAGNAFDLNVGTTIGSTNAQHLLPAPAMPASGVALANPFPFDVDLVIDTAGVINFVTIAGANLTAANRNVTVKRGGTVAINYSSTPPTWVWFRK